MSKFTYTDGCTATSIEVDGQSFSELSSQEKIETMKKLIDYVCQQPSDHARNDLLRDVMILLIPDIATDEHEFQYDSDDENALINVYVYKDDKDKVIVIDNGFDDQVITNGYSYFAYNLNENDRALFYKIIEKSVDNCFLNNIFMDILRTYGETEYLCHCDQCGDSVWEYTLNI